MHLFSKILTTKEQDRLKEELKIFVVWFVFAAAFIGIILGVVHISTPT